MSIWWREPKEHVEVLEVYYEICTDNEKHYEKFTYKSKSSTLVGDSLLYFIE